MSQSEPQVGADLEVATASWESVVGALRAQFRERVQSLVQQAFDRHREFFACYLQRRMGEVSGSVTTQASVSAGGDEGWSEIASLSQLRALVGGRFQNLKDRWVQSGFPLKEHRGDKSLDYRLNESGWLELSSWISKQGYEVRLRPDKEKCLFELKKR